MRQKAFLLALCLLIGRAYCASPPGSFSRIELSNSNPATRTNIISGDTSGIWFQDPIAGKIYLSALSGAAGIPACLGSGDMIYGISAGTWGRFGVPGGDGHILHTAAAGTIPAWSTSTWGDTYAINSIPYASAANTIAASPKTLIYANGNVHTSGTVTATAFVGDGSGLTGISSGGGSPFTDTPTGSGVGDGPLYVNPATDGGDLNNTLQGWAVGGSEVVRIDAAGDVEIDPLAINGGVLKVGAATYRQDGLQLIGGANFQTNGTGDTKIGAGTTITLGIGNESDIEFGAGLKHSSYNSYNNGSVLLQGTTYTLYMQNLYVHLGSPSNGDVLTYQSSTGKTIFSTPSASGSGITTSSADLRYQPLDSDLTYLAGFTPAANVKSILNAADYSAIRTLLGLVIGTNVQAYDADLTTYAGITPSANVQTMLGSADNAAIRTNIGLGSLATQSGTFSGTSSGTNTGDQSGANPTATAAGTAINGSATTFMRSDGAPAIQTASDSVPGLMSAADHTKLTNVRTHYFAFKVGNKSTVPAAQDVDWLYVPFACTITGVELAADVSGSAVFDVWVDSYANYPPTVADTITASAKPTLSSAIKYKDTTLTGWSVSVPADSYIKVHLDSCSTCMFISGGLTYTKN